MQDEWSFLACGHCKYFRVNADQNNVESVCKRLDHKRFQFAIPWFKSYDCGQCCACVCKDFSPSPLFKWLYDHWKSYDDYFGTDYVPSQSGKLIGICLDGDQSVRYMIDKAEFIEGKFLNADGSLHWIEKHYYKQSRSSPIGYIITHEKNPERL